MVRPDPPIRRSTAEIARAMHERSRSRTGDEVVDAIDMSLVRHGFTDDRRDYELVVEGFRKAPGTRRLLHRFCVEMSVTTQLSRATS